MSASGRGPTGAASLPPDWLKSVHLPLKELGKESSLLRIHASDRDPIFFSPGFGHTPVGRFDSAGGHFGVLYVAAFFEGAFVETVLRNPRRRLIGLAEIGDRSIAVLAFSRAIRLVPMDGAALQSLGVDNGITTGPYEPCGVWADALFTHPDRPDGIIYPSRHDPDQACVALFRRADLAIEVASESVPLLEMLPEVASVLRRYGKGIAGN